MNLSSTSPRQQTSTDAVGVIECGKTEKEVPCGCEVKMEGEDEAGGEGCEGGEVSADNGSTVFCSSNGDKSSNGGGAQSGVGSDHREKYIFPEQRTKPVVGIGLDSCVMALPHDGLFLVQTTDFFYPLVDDPFVMGKITCANVLSDLYAMGVTDVDNMSMLIGVSEKLTDEQRDIVIPLITRGFLNLAAEAGTKVTGLETVINPWLTIGGVATSVCHRSEFIMPNSAQAGDILVLTKPIGTQVAVNAHQWLSMPERWQRVSQVVTVEDVELAYQRAMSSMSRLNRTGARLMHKYEAHGGTDVTGFGLLGHAKNLAKEQTNDVSFVIQDLPIIANMAAIANALGAGFGLMRGTSAETSGGLLVILDPAKAESFCKEIEEIDGFPAWIIGHVENGGGRTAAFSDCPRVVEVPSVTTEGKIW